MGHRFMLTARFLQDVVDVVRESGDIIRRQWEKTHAVRHKGSIDLVTETDVAVEAFLKERLGELLPQAEFLAEDAVVATGFPYAIAERLDDVLARLALVLPKAQGVRRIGAASVDLAYVAAGRQDAFYEMLLKPWDVAAGWLLVEEAGGRVTTLDGRPYTFGDEIMASNGLVHKELRHLLAAVTPVRAERRPA